MLPVYGTAWDGYQFRPSWRFQKALPQVPRKVRHRPPTVSFQSKVPWWAASDRLALVSRTVLRRMSNLSLALLPSFLPLLRPIRLHPLRLRLPRCGGHSTVASVRGGYRCRSRGHHRQRIPRRPPPPFGPLKYLDSSGEFVTLGDEQ